ncbi:helix-turn-helix domain-containing protein [Pseudoruegeria sp. HB172150]|uniref:winged helix-turn-helix transcriptional regulator n=1 Tax=Pseudoruegeria sp. HB172150 TaxID=2721164 RepID=UPI0015538D37|nr:helix-turn-helix domain-containing protein [Pseudoruegeria sp. HB172150]
MAETSYRQFCPVAMAADILCTRWTLMVVRELVAGTTRFNDLRRGLARMSPALLSKRLKELEAAGIVERVLLPGSETYEYRLTQSGHELRPVVEALGCWGQRWIEKDLTLDNLDVGLLMWDMRRHLNTDPMPPRKSTVQFTYSDQPDARRRWWLIVEADGDVDLCSVDPGHDVDLYVSTNLRTMTEIWLGYSTVAMARETDRLHLIGNMELERQMQTWLGLNPFSVVERMVA